jgi:molybdopterin molybdotransferase
MVTFHLFVRPAIDRMLGRAETGLRTGQAFLDEDIDLAPGRMQFLRGVLVGDGPELRVAAYPEQKSGVLKSMVRSRVLIVVDADVARLQRGEEVDILFLE